jgi:methylthioribose-1-phosphate isomerase
LAVKQYIDEDEESFLEYISKAKEDLLATRPTAVNLSWSINKMEKQLEKGLKNNSDKRNILKNLLKIADNIAKEDIKTNKKIGQFGNELIDVVILF